MSNKKCSCSGATCDCCEGVSILTPQSEENRPGLDTLSYRAGTHGSFLETMKARLAGFTLQAVGADGQTMTTFRPLAGLTTRDSSDPAIAFLDSWAMVGDVLTFYQERIANEGYLRTATERRSVLELARLVGYKLGPGVSATVYLAYNLDSNQTDPVVIPAGSRSQSIPGPGELPQYFETSDDLYTRTEWNNLLIRQTQPQNITLSNALQIETIYVGELSTNLKTGDVLLLSFGNTDLTNVMRRVKSIEGQFLQNRTLIHLQPVFPAIWATVPLLAQFVSDAQALKLTDGPSGRAIFEAVELLNNSYLEIYSSPVSWSKDILSAPDGTIDPKLQTLVDNLETQVLATLKQLGGGTGGDEFTDPSLFVPGLLKPANLQPASTLQLPRALNVQLEKASDVHPQLLVTFAPTLDNTLYEAWANSNVETASPTLLALYAVRTAAPLFGATVSKVPDSTKPANQWADWDLDSTESTETLFLDRPYESILPGSLLVIQKPDGSSLVRNVYQVETAQTTPRSAYGISGNSSRLTVDRDWWFGNQDSMFDLRGTYVYGQTEELTVIEEPILTDVSGQELELGDLYKEITSGRWVIVSGERADIEGVSGVTFNELIMVSGIRQGVDADLPGDKTHTTLLLATPTAYTYKRSTLTIYGNVVKATNGQTRNEILGSGDSSQLFASFVLKQPPLTYVSDPNPTGVLSTLAVYVNNVQWQELPALSSAQSKDRVFMTSTDDSANTTVIFGNGENGALPPSGVQNLTAIYRSDLGSTGNVRANQISMLVNQPLGVKGVINPLAASGGADRESRDQARSNAPLAVMSLDRLVSTDDYADFTRTYAGIGKAASRRITDGRRALVHVTIAGAGDIPIDQNSDFYQNLLLALRTYGDPSLPVQVDLRELLILVLSANVRILAAYKWDIVSAAIRAEILDQFGFDHRDLGMPALLCELIAAIQNVEGVDSVDVVGFGGIPEKKAASDGTRELLTLDELAEAASEIANSESIPRYVAANLADFENGGIRPAQLAIFTPDVPDTIILNQVL
jgi:predicted phage baseplate assembly protein